ncbi:MAG: M50 family metallopeptidase [Rhodospirillaceae bacterium]
MDVLANFLEDPVPTLVLVTVLVLVHEAGFYLAARWFGLRLETASFGLGPIAFQGVRWRLRLLPVAGFVKMAGISRLYSVSSGQTQALSAWRLAVIFMAGPMANFFFAVLLLASLFTTHGHLTVLAKVGSIQPGSAAETAGMETGDVIVEVDGRSTSTFDDVRAIINQAPGRSLTVVVERIGGKHTLTVVPSVVTVTDRSGATRTTGSLGIGKPDPVFRLLNPVSAVVTAVEETGGLISGVLNAVGRVFISTVAADPLGGPLGGPLRLQHAPDPPQQDEFMLLVWTIAVYSVMIALIALIPVPPLDGWNLLCCAVAVVRRGRR